MKKAVSIFLLLLLLATMAACADAPSSPIPVIAPTPQATAQPVTITFFWREGGDIQVPEDSYICQKILDDLGIVYRHIAPSGGMTFDEALQELLASKQVPDIMESRNDLTVSLRDLGAIIPIEEYINEATIPNIIRNQYNWDAALALVTGSDGVIWELPVTMPNDVELVPYIRYDWLANLGLDVPTDAESLATVLTAFTHDDPDGDGLDNTVGAMWLGMAGVAYNMGGNPDDWISDGAGGLKLRMDDATIREYSRYLKRLIDSGGLERQITDPDVRAGSKMWDWIKSGKVGFNFSYNTILDNTEMRKTQPDADWRPMAPPRGIYDKGYRPVRGTLRQTYVVSSQCGDRLDAVWRLLDYMACDNSNEYFINYDAPYWEVSFGKRGVNWDVIDGRFVNGLPNEYFYLNNEVEPWNINCRRFRTKWQFAALRASWTPEERGAWDLVQTYPKTSEWVFGKDPSMPLSLEGIDMPEKVAAFTHDWFSSGLFSSYQVNWLLGRRDLDADHQAMIAQAESEGLREIERIMIDAMRAAGRI